MPDRLAPSNHLAVERFGKGDPRKLRLYLLMLAAFLEGKPDNTRRAYKTGLRQFFDLFDWISPEDVTAAHAAAFKKWLLQTRSESTAYYRMSGVSSFFNYLCMPPDASSEPLIRSNPFKLVPRHDIQPTPYAHAKAMEWEVFRTIVDGVPGDALGMRDKAILLFLAFTGRRRQEVASLRIRDLDLQSKPRSYTCRTKGGRVRTFELPDICYEAIRAYWIIADRLDDLRPDAGVFTAVRATPLNRHLDPHRPLNVRTLNKMLRRCVVRAGLDPDDDSIGIHAMRHMTARDLDKAGMRLQDIQAFLDHASPLTTRIYLGHLSGPVMAHTEALIRVRSQAEALAREAIRTGPAS
jgi:integrase